MLDQQTSLSTVAFIDFSEIGLVSRSYRLMASFFFFLLYWARGEVLRFWLLVHFVLASLVALFHLHQRPNGIDRLSSEH